MKYTVSDDPGNRSSRMPSVLSYLYSIPASIQVLSLYHTNHNDEPPTKTSFFWETITLAILEILDVVYADNINIKCST